MADDVTYQSATPATPPSGTVIATDEAGSPARQYQLVKLVDGSANSETPIPALAAQPAGSEAGLVVRPASVVPDVTASGTIAADEETVSIAMAGRSTVVFSLIGTFVGMLRAEGSIDEGATYPVQFQLFQMPQSDSLSETPFEGVYVIADTLAGMSHVRVRADAWTSGSVAVVLRASTGNSNVSPALAIAPSGTSMPGAVLMVGARRSGGTSDFLWTKLSTPDGTESGLITREAARGQGTMAASIPVVIASNQSAVSVDGSGVTQPISAVALPLPTGAATAAKQDGIIRDGTGDTTEANVSGGRLHVDPSGVTSPISAASLPLPTGAATAAKQDDQTASLQLIDDAVHADDAVRGKSLVIGAVLDDAATTTITENQAGYVRMSSRRALLVEGVASGAAVTVAQATATNLKVDASGVAVPVTDNGGSLTVDAPIGTPVNVQVGNATLAAGVVDETGTSAVDTLAVGGGTPHDSVDSGNPIKLGVKAASAFPTAVAANDRANVIGDLWGRPMVTHIDPAQQVWKSFNATSAQTGVTIWDPTSGKKIAITSIVIGTYGTTAGRAILWFGANGDTTYSAGTDQLVLAFSSAPSTSSKPGLVFCPAVPIFCTTADMELHITTDANLSIDVAVAGYEWA